MDLRVGLSRSWDVKYRWLRRKLERKRLRPTAKPGIRVLRWGSGTRREESMTLQRRDFLLVVTLAAAVATPAFGQAVAPTVAPANSGKEKSAASTPDFSGMWVHGSIPGFEPLSSGPTSLVNRSRRSTAQLIRDLVVDWQGPGEPPSEDGV